MKQKSRGPGKIEGIPDVDMLKMREVIDIAPFPSLPDTFQAIVQPAFFGEFMQSQTKRRKSALSCDVRGSLVIQAKIVKVRAQPGDLIRFPIHPQKQTARIVRQVESHLG